MDLTIEEFQKLADEKGLQLILQNWNVSWPKKRKIVSIGRAMRNSSRWLIRQRD